MYQVKYGTKDEPGFALELSQTLIAVRTRSRRPVRGRGPVLPPAAAAVADGTLVTVFPEAGVEVFRVPAAAGSVDDRKRALAAAPDIRFAGSVLVHPGTEEPVLYTENFYLRFREDVEADVCEQVIRDAGLTLKDHLDFATNAYFVAAPEGTGRQVFAIADQLLSRPDVLYCHPELVQQRRKKQIFAQQWHLKVTEFAGTAVDAHANVEAAHLLSLGAGVTIAVIDDGVDIDHPEFRGSGKVVAPRDTTLGLADPRPKDTLPSREDGENHGTACAGVACANGANGACGVAPQARLMPIREVSGLGSVAEARAFQWAADHGADVISCSWGPADGRWWDVGDPLHGRMVRLPASSRDAIDYAVTHGRGGKGCVVLFAAGNGNESVDNDGYASYPKVIAVAACNDRSRRSVYSDYGEAIWCTFPSSDFGHGPFDHAAPLTNGIWTTDRLRQFGYNAGAAATGDVAGAYTNDFGGTSSACPGAAGVAALVLSVNPALRWDQVKELLRRACDPIDLAKGEYDAGGHSKYYGYGRLNAERAVKLAQEATARSVSVIRSVNVPIPDLGVAEGVLEVAETSPPEQLGVYVRLNHTYIGDLVIRLLPPPGSGLPETILHNRAGGSRRNLDTLFESSSVPGLTAYAGKPCNGRWTVRVDDKAAQDEGRLLEIGLRLTLPA